MCGRFVQITDPEKIRMGLFELDTDVAALMEFFPRYNITPSRDILTVINTPVPKLIFTRWGLIPSWAKDRSIGNHLINAKAETLLARPSFRDPFRRHRCIIFSDGFYEWKGSGKTKTPFFIRLKSREPFCFAGLWDRWTDRATGENILSSAIITTDANAAVAGIHNRMPAILDPGDYRVWLSAGAEPDRTLMGCLKPYAAQEMEAYEISRFVNNPGNDSAECIRSVIH
ncbi:MAG TPA: SOS response-associated peptidase [Desulfomonilia bacterium]|nr:SOS response-associated peptidase [Desulfomonilia bacterium]